MSLSNINFSINKASQKDIFKHLEKCNNDFCPVLSSYVNILEYSKKIFLKADTFEAWEHGKLVGLVACYSNADKNATAYISNVSILKRFYGKKLAWELLCQVIDYNKSMGFNSFELDVFKRNKRAGALYLRFGFKKMKLYGEKVKMKLVL